jgi:hypothetical protein
MLKQFIHGLTIIVAVTSLSWSQKAWVSPPAYGLVASENSVNPGIDLIDILPPDMTANISAWDWLTEDKVIFTNWVWNFTVTPLGEIWVLEGMKAQDKSKITLKRYFPGTLREPLGVKVVNGDVYVVVKFALLKFVDANKDGIAEDTVQIAEFPHKPEPSGGWNHYSLDLKYRSGFFYVALPSETVAGGYPGYPVLPGRGTVAKIDPVKKSLEFLITGLRTPDGLGWGPDSSLFVTDNQGAWLPASKLIHVTKNRFFGLQPIEAGDPNLVESPPAIWMPQSEASSSPTQPMLLEKGSFAGQFLIGDNVLGFVNRVALDKVKNEYQGALFHFTGGLTCGVHRLLQNAAGDLYFGGLGSPINTWNVKGHFYGMQVAKFNAFEVKAILSRADGFTLQFTAPAGPSAEDPANYKIRQWRYQPTKDYGGNKLDNVVLTPGEISMDPSRAYVHIKVPGLVAGRVVNFQFHKDLMSLTNTPIWTGEAWYTLNQISAESGLFPTRLGESMEQTTLRQLLISRTGNTYAIVFPKGDFYDFSILTLDGKTVFHRNAKGLQKLVVDRGEIKSGLCILSLRYRNGTIANRSFVFN